MVIDKSACLNRFHKFLDNGPLAAATLDGLPQGGVCGFLCNRAGTCGITPLERVPGARLSAHYVTLLRRLQGANTGFNCSVIVGAKC